MGDFSPDPNGNDDPLEGVGEALNDYEEEKEKEKEEILEGLNDAINDIQEEEEQQSQPETEFSLFPDEDEELQLA